jgi:hypothetical protein
MNHDELVSTVQHDGGVRPIDMLARPNGTVSMELYEKLIRENHAMSKEIQNLQMKYIDLLELVVKLIRKT